MEEEFDVVDMNEFENLYSNPLEEEEEEEEELDEFGNAVFNENIFGEYADYIPFSDVISDSVKAAKTAYSGSMASDETLKLGWGKLTEDKIDAF